MNKSDSADAGKTRSHRVKLVSISRDDEIPASSFQERMYFLFELNPKNTGSNGLLLYDVTGFVDQRLIKESLLSLIKRYEVFRTQFKRVKDKIVQIITPASEASVVFSFSDLSQLTSTQQNTSLKEATAKLDYKPFDLGKGPLCRFQLFKLTDDHFVLAQVHHHIITDHFTNNIFIQELSRVYSALKTGSPLNLPNIDFQYADFAAWEKANVTEEFIGPQIKYWKENLTNAPNLLHLPLDRPRPSKTGSNFRTESIIIPNESWNQLKIIGFKERATPAILGMAVFSILLHRFSGDNDICIGAPIEMRARRGLFSLMGPMIDNFVIRSKYNKKIIFPEYLANFVASSLNAYANCDVSIDKVISLAGSVRSMSYAPLYQTMFQFFSKNQDEVAPATKDLIFTNRGGGHVGAQDMDIVCQLEESRNEVNLKFAYNADLFVRETILQMLSSFNNLTEEIVKKPLEEIGNLTLLSPVLKRKSILERPDKIQNIKNAEEI